MRQTDLRVMLAGPKGRAVGESGELDKAARKGDGNGNCDPKFLTDATDISAVVSCCTLTSFESGHKQLRSGLPRTTGRPNSVPGVVVVDRCGLEDQEMRFDPGVFAGVFFESAEDKSRLGVATASWFLQKASC
eukprot:9504051-Pyramimonas_sp.AAC.3